MDLRMGTVVWFYKSKNAIKDRLRPYWWSVQGSLNFIVLLIARGLLRLFPSTQFVTRDSIYPPSELCQSTKLWMTKYGEKIGARYIDVEPSCVVTIALPKTPHSVVRQQLAMDRDYEWPATFVVTIPNGRVWGDGHIITPDNQLLGDLSCDFRAQRWTLFPKTSSVVRYWSWRDVVEYDARVAVLATDGAENYYHWLFQLLPRIQLLREAGIDLRSIDYFVVNNLNKSFQRDTINALGIEPSKFVESSKIPYLRARQLIVPSIPIGGGCYRRWMCEFLRATFPGDTALQNAARVARRLYISRGLASYRRVLNEIEVIRLLRRHGFEEIKFEGLSVLQQAESMASCEAIVAPHGAGLSNIVFCQPGTKLIEIFSPELVTGIFWRLASQLNLDYYYIVGKGSPETQQEDYQQSWNARADIVVDLSILQKALELSGLAQDKSRLPTDARLSATADGGPI
jgi:capsular polysaccharide biosynthesis protein